MARRQPVTFAVLAGADRRATRAFLAKLSPEAIDGDNAVVLHHEGDEGTWRIWQRQGGFKPASPGNGAPRLRDVVVVLDERIETSRDLIDQLCAAISLDGVGAVAPRANLADGDELLLGIPYRPYEPGVRHSFLTQRVSSASGHVEPAARLGGPCVAFRRAALSVPLPQGLWDPAARSAELAGAGHRLLVTDGGYVHHPGGEPLGSPRHMATRPLVSACLIVRDEHDDLPRCLESCRGVVDEIVVYDTGSVDDTRELAAHYGATVIEGYWDDDFARARNDALAHCAGQWILWLDADEALVVAPDVDLRAVLAAAPTAVEGYLVLVDNLRGTLTSNVLSHPACRLFRRANGHWDGRIHEQIVAREGNPDLALELTDTVRITHWGYLQAAVAKRDKGERNLRTAFGDLAGGSELERGARLASLGRSYLFAGRLAEGIDLCRMAAAMAERPSTKHLALRGAIEGLLAARDPQAALHEISALRACSEVGTLADVLEGQALLALERHADALAVLERVGHGLDDDGFEYQPELVAGAKAEALVGLDRFDEAADLLLGVLREGGGIDVHIGVLIDALERAGRDLAETAVAIGATRLRAFLPPLLQLQADAANRALDAWYRVFGPDTALLAAAAQVAHRMPIESQLVWSARLRQHDLAQACPLVAATTDLALSARDRIVAAAVAITAFGDTRAEPAFVANALGLAADERPAVREQLAALNGALLATFDALAPQARPDDVAPRRVRNPREVLIVERAVSSARAIGLAAVTARLGHRVTLVTPQPAAGAETALAAHGVAVQGWREDPHEPDAWLAPCLRLVAHLYAEHRFDVVVVGQHARDALPALRDALPVASFVLDVGAGAAPEDLAAVELCITAPGDRPSAVPVRPVAAPREAWALPVPVVPASMRRGICVVGETRQLDADALATLEELGGALAGAGVPVAVVGDDPSERLARPFAAPTLVGPIADPSAWLAASRVVLVASAVAADAWLDAAAWAGTPAVLLATSGAQVAECAGTLLTLVSDDEAFAAAALRRHEGEFPYDGEDFIAALPRPWERDPGALSGEIVVRLVGAIDSLDSLAQVNRALVDELSAGGHPFSLSVLARDAPASMPFAANGVSVARDASRLAPATVEIRHQWPPDFSPSAASRLVLIQPWEFGGLPAEWVGPLRDVVDELWVPTHFVRDGAIESGLDPDRVVVVPNGVDVARYRPDGGRRALRTAKRTKLLFVGGLIERKGVDALLEAYLTAFDAADEVCLVIKPYGSGSVYRNATLEPAVRRAAEGGGAEIEFVDGDLSAEHMAELYRACDVLVHPYRGEGFGLPIAEAMASGLAVVVPDSGACRDFCDEDNAFLVKTERVDITPAEWTPSRAGAWWLEPNRTSLVAALLDAVADPLARARKGEAARQRIVEHFTWGAAADIAAKRILELTRGAAGADGTCR